LIRHAEINSSILQEEPKGLFGAAVLLRESDVSAFVETARGQQKDGSTIRDVVFSFKGLDKSKFLYDHKHEKISLARGTSSDVELNVLPGSLEISSTAVQSASGVSPTRDAEPDVTSRPSSPSPVEGDVETAQGLGTGLQRAGSRGDESRIRDSEQRSVHGSSDPPSPPQDDGEMAQRLGTGPQHGMA
jgi:hypothetical protein